MCTYIHTYTHVQRCVEVVRFIKENSVGIFMSRIAVQEDGAGGTEVSSDGASGTITTTPEDAMMGRMGILVVCRFERLLVEEQVSFCRWRGLSWPAVGTVHDYSVRKLFRLLH